MLSTVPGRNSQIQCQSMCFRTAAMSPMILWCMTQRCLIIQRSPTENDERRGTDTMLTAGIKRNDAMTPKPPPKLNLPIFRDPTSDNTITYDDWRCDVDNCVREGHSTTLIRDSVLSALEGRPCCTAMTAMEDSNR